MGILLSILRNRVRPEPKQPDVVEPLLERPAPESVHPFSQGGQLSPFRRFHLSRINEIGSPARLVFVWEATLTLYRALPDLCLEALFRQTSTDELVRLHVIGLSCRQFYNLARLVLQERQTLVIVIRNPTISAVLDLPNMLEDDAIKLDYQEARPEWLHPDVLMGQPPAGPLFGHRKDFLFVNNAPNQDQLAWIRDHFPNLRILHIVHHLAEIPNVQEIIVTLDHQLYTDRQVSVNRWVYEIRQRYDEEFLFVGFLPNVHNRRVQ